ncbi:cathepsin B-like isoform X1 [Diaphorina citri]|uniref:Cathepsin B-like isoform X1 n=1 Tax=Diaphorina citri TaxID=121845 RepID=A0A1S3D691_DIACI|nr:cathepsin B-like isoform X1 [Diaphorina citri]
MIVPLVLLSAALAVSAAPYQEELIASVKENAADLLLWEPGMNFHPDATPEDFTHLIGNYSIEPRLAAHKKKSNCEAVCYGHEDNKNVPETFDARKKWPQCESIGKVQDQGDCKADYVSMMSSNFEYIT